MASEPFLASQTRPPLPKLESLLVVDHEHDFQFLPPLISSISSPNVFFEEIIVEEDNHNTSPPPPPPPDDDDDDDARNNNNNNKKNKNNSNNKKKKKIHRCKTAPAMAIMQDLKQPPPKQQAAASSSNEEESKNTSLVRQAFILLIIYLSLGVAIYSFNRDHFSGVETHPVVDALYFCIVTMCTIGYGDIAPLTPFTKLFACFFVLVGFGFIDVLLSGVVNYVLDLQENMILTGISHSTPHSFSATATKKYIVDVEKGRMRIRLKVGLALGVVVLSIGMGALVLYFVEELDWIDSIYLSVMSVTTVGYGDRAFKTLPGRLFASIWLLFSTLTVARAFLYLAEARIDKRHRRITKWVLHRDITVHDLLAADTNNNGFIRNYTSGMNNLMPGRASCLGLTE